MNPFDPKTGRLIDASSAGVSYLGSQVFWAGYRCDCLHNSGILGEGHAMQLSSCNSLIGELVW